MEAHGSLCVAYEHTSYFYLGYAAYSFSEIDDWFDFGGGAAYGIGIYLATHARTASKASHASHDAHGRPPYGMSPSLFPPNGRLAHHRLLAQRRLQPRCRGAHP